jgi:thioredoxin-like negative regulator of GroEL
MLAFQRGEYEAARAEFEQVLRDYPLHKQSYPVLAQCYRRLRRPADAARVLKSYAALDTMDLDTAPLEYSLWAMPDNVALRVKLARLYVKYRRPDLAATQVALALETNPGYPDALRLQEELRKKP